MSERSLTIEILAGGAISLALLDALVENGAVSKIKALSILRGAQADLMNSGTDEALSAANLIASLITKFTQNL